MFECGSKSRYVKILGKGAWQSDWNSEEILQLQLRYFRPCRTSLRHRAHDVNFLGPCGRTKAWIEAIL